MFQALISVARNASKLALSNSRTLLVPQNNLVSSLYQRHFSLLQSRVSAPPLLSPVTATPLKESSRTVTKFSIRKGKRKSVRVVLTKFYRLNWGIWIRRIAGAHKKMWKKSMKRKYKLQQHVFCNATQSRLLDKMVGSFWRKPRYYVDDPYNPYHTREEFKYTAMKPKPYYPPEA